MTDSWLNIRQIIRLAGLGQIVLALGSLAVPKVLAWRAELAKTAPLIKQMFWVYAGYIFVINLSFGLVSLVCAGDLTDGSKLASLLTGFIAAYWVSRVLIQFFYFDRNNFPAGGWNRLAEFLLVAAFVFFSLVYGWACGFNLQLIK
jgi:hypothetical protein